MLSSPKPAKAFQQVVLDGTPHAIGHGFWRLDGDGWQPLEAPVGLLRGAARAFGTTWLLDDSGRLWREEEGAWVEAGLPALRATDPDLWALQSGEWVLVSRDRWPPTPFLLHGTAHALWVANRSGATLRTADGVNWEPHAVPDHPELKGLFGTEGRTWTWGDGRLYMFDSGWQPVDVPVSVRRVELEGELVHVGSRKGGHFTVRPNGVACDADGTAPVERVIQARSSQIKAWAHADRLVTASGLWTDTLALFVKTEAGMVPRVTVSGLTLGIVLDVDPASGTAAWSSTDRRHLYVTNLYEDEAPRSYEVPPFLHLSAAGGHLFLLTEQGIVRVGGDPTSVVPDMEVEVLHGVAGNRLWFTDTAEQLYSVPVDGGPVTRHGSDPVGSVVLGDERVAWVEYADAGPQVWSTRTDDLEARLEHLDGGPNLRIVRDSVLRYALRDDVPVWLDSSGTVVDRARVSRYWFRWLVLPDWVLALHDDGLVVEVELMRVNDPGLHVAPNDGNTQPEAPPGP